MFGGQIIHGKRVFLPVTRSAALVAARTDEFFGLMVDPKKDISFEVKKIKGPLRLIKVRKRVFKDAANVFQSQLGKTFPVRF